jgi:O-antigen ligase
MIKLALAAAVASGGLYTVFAYLSAYDLLTFLYPQILFCAPAVALGIATLLGHTSVSVGFTHPLSLVLALMVAGLAWVDRSEIGRGLLITASALCAFSIAPCLARYKASWFCIKCFILTSALSLLFVFVMSRGDAGFGSLGSFGTLADADGSLVSNANDFAGQMALACALCGLGLLTGSLDALFSRPLYLLMMLSFALAVLLSASRSSIIALAIMALVLLIYSPVTRRHVLLSAAVIASFVTILLIVYLLSSTVSDVAEKALSRFTDDTVSTLGDRVTIWSAAPMIVSQHPAALVIGLGTGGVDKGLGAFATTQEGSLLGKDGIPRHFSHNTYVEWFLSYGIVGCIPALGFLLYSVKAIHSERDRDARVLMIMLFVYFNVWSIGTVAYRAPYIIGIESVYMTALLSPKEGCRVTSKRVS